MACQLQIEYESIPVDVGQTGSAAVDDRGQVESSTNATNVACDSFHSGDDLPIGSPLDISTDAVDVTSRSKYIVHVDDCIHSKVFAMNSPTLAPDGIDVVHDEHTRVSSGALGGFNASVSVGTQANASTATTNWNNVETCDRQTSPLVCPREFVDAATSPLSREQRTADSNNHHDDDDENEPLQCCQVADGVCADELNSSGTAVLCSNYNVWAPLDELERVLKAGMQSVATSSATSTEAAVNEVVDSCSLPATRHLVDIDAKNGDGEFEHNDAVDTSTVSPPGSRRAPAGQTRSPPDDPLRPEDVASSPRSVVVSSLPLVDGPRDELCLMASDCHVDTDTGHYQVAAADVRSMAPVAIDDTNGQYPLQFTVFDLDYDKSRPEAANFKDCEERTAVKLDAGDCAVTSVVCLNSFGNDHVADVKSDQDLMSYHKDSVLKIPGQVTSISRACFASDDVAMGRRWSGQCIMSDSVSCFEQAGNIDEQIKMLCSEEQPWDGLVSCELEADQGSEDGLSYEVPELSSCDDQKTKSCIIT